MSKVLPRPIIGYKPQTLNHGPPWPPSSYGPKEESRKPSGKRTVGGGAGRSSCSDYSRGLWPPLL